MEKSEEMGIHLLREGLADVAFMYAPIPKDLESHVIIEREPLCAVIKRENPLAEKENIDIEDLVEYALIFSSGNNITRKNIIKKAKETAGEELENIPVIINAGTAPIAAAKTPPPKAAINPKILIIFSSLNYV